jgi:hypothetical protein
MRYARLKGMMLAAGLAAPALHDAGAAEFVLVNTSGVTIEQLYISPCGHRVWGRNQLAGQPLWSTRAFSVSDINPGCYDVMVVLPPWNECILAGASLQRGLSWTISKSTVTQAIFGDCSQSPNIVMSGRRPLRTD